MARLLDLLNDEEVETVIPTETPEEVEPELLEGEPEVKAEVEEEEPKDFEFELDDEPEPEVKPKVQAEDALVHKLSKKGRQLKAAKTELEKANERIAELEAGRAPVAPIPTPAAQEPPEQSLAQQYGYPPVPVLYENGVNSPAEFHEAYMKWDIGNRNIDAQRTAAANKTAAVEQEMESKLQRLGADSDKFFTDKGIDPERGTDFVANAVNEIDAHTKLEGSMIYLLEAVGEGSSAVAYHLGSKSAKGIAALNKVKSLLASDPNGLSAVAYMASLKRDLTPKRKQVKTDIEPDEALVGGSNSLKASSLQRKYDEEQDFTKLRAIMREAKSLGIELKSS